MYVLPKHLNEKVVRLQLKKLNAVLTVLTEEQAKYIHVPLQAPYKPDTYRTDFRGREALTESHVRLFIFLNSVPVNGRSFDEFQKGLS